MVEKLEEGGSEDTVERRWFVVEFNNGEVESAAVIRLKCDWALVAARRQVWEDIAVDIAIILLVAISVLYLL